MPKTLEEARVLHNQTAGSPQGIAAARSLGDLSHMVYARSLASKQSGATAGELLFLDINPGRRGYAVNLEDMETLYA